MALAGAFTYACRHAETPAPGKPTGTRYVVAPAVDVMDTSAQIRQVIGHLKAGDRVEVISETAHWCQIALPGGKSGWIESKNLLDGAAYERGQALFESLQNQPPQASGHTSAPTHLRLDASRDAVVLVDLDRDQKLDVFGRRLVARSAPGASPAKAHPEEAWYLVRAGTRAGWMLGRFVDLDIPAGISMYAQDVNMVGWLVLKSVPDDGRDVPEYLAVDRMAAEGVDFNHLRVFTWWRKDHKYVTAYVEGGVAGFFPIEVQTLTDTRFAPGPVPYFRLRLVDSDGRHYQKIYGLFDTIVRSVGTVDGWESKEMPAVAARSARPPRRAQAAKGRGRRPRT